MNRIYSLVFNRALGQLQVASELGGRSHGGAGHSTRGPRPALTCLALSLALAWLPAGAQAQAAPAPGQLPTGPNVIQGANAPTIDGLRMTIEQTDARALIRWDSFDIGADAAVHFQQGLGQAVLNQIGGGDASQIFGQLTGDGRVFLINPNGIVFGAEAQVNVGSLVASGLAMTTSEQDFLGGADELHFAAGGAGVVVNRGDIRGTDASGQGNVALLGRAVHNEGDIGGTLTMIDLVAADAATLSAGGVYEFTPTAAVAGAGAALVTNSGTLESQGGRITLAASADPFGGVLINSSGIISAAGFVEGESGAVRLRAAGGGIEVSGTVTATGNTLTIDAGRDAVALTNSENRLDGARVNVTAGATEIATQGDLNLYMVDTLDLTVNSGGALNLGRGTIGGVVNARSGGPITRSFEAPLTLGRSGALSTLDAGGHDILLADERGGTLFMGNFDVTGADVYLESTGAMMLNRISTDSLYAIGTHGVMLGTGTVDGSLTVHSYGGVVGQVAGGLTVGGGTYIDSPGAVTLADAGNDFQGEVRLTGRDVHIVDRNGLDLQAVTASGDFTVSSNGVLNLGAGRIDGSLTATSNGHAIGQRGGLTVAGAATIDAGAADIALDAANDFRGAVALTGGAVRVRDINDLDIRALVGGTGGVDLQAGGNLLLPTGDIDTGSADLRLVAGGTLGTPGALHGANVTLHGGTGLDLDHDVTATSGLSLGGGVGAIQQNAGRIAAVRLDVEGGSARLDAAGNAVGALGDVDVAGAFALRNAQAIQQAAGTTVKVGGAASFDAGGQEIVLANAGNDFGGAVSLAGGTVRISDANALTLGDLTVSGDLVATSHGALGLGGGSVGGTLAATSNGGDVGQGGALAVAGTSTIDAGTGAIRLGREDNAFGGTVDLSGRDLAIGTAGALALGTVSASGNLVATSHGDLEFGQVAVGGALTATSNGGDIRQVGALTVGADGTTSAIDAGAGTVVLDHQDNDFRGRLGLTGGDTTLRDANALTLGTLATGALTVTSSGALNLGAGSIGGNLLATSGDGAITQAGRLSVEGNATIDAGAGSIRLVHIGLPDQFNDFKGEVRLAGRDGISVYANNLTVVGDIETDGNLYLEARGTLDGSGVLTTTGAVIAGPEMVLAGNRGIALGGAIAVDRAIGLRAGSGHIQTAHAITARRLDVTAGGNVALTGDNVVGSLGRFDIGGDLELHNTLDLHQNENTRIEVAGDAHFDARGNAIRLDSTTNDFGGGVRLAGGSITIRDANDLDIRALVGGSGGVDLQAGGNLLLAAGDIDTGGADLRLVAGGTLATPGTLRGANVTLRGGTGLDLGHDVTAASGLSLAGGAIQQSAGRIAAARLDVEGGSARLDAAGNAVDELGDVDVAGAFTLRNTQAIRQAAGTTVEVGGAASFDAGGQEIVLANAGNDFGGPVSLTGSDVTIHDANALRLGNLAVSGDLVATSTGDLGLGAGRIDGSLTAISNGGNVGQSGGLAVGGTAGIDAGSGDIAFADTLSNDFRGTVSLTGGAVRIANSRALTLGAVDAASLSVITAGPITQAAGTRIDVTGAADFDASTTAITLTNDNDFGGAVSLRGGATHIHDRGDLTLGTVATSALSVEAGGDLNLGTGSTGHIVASSGGDITQSGMLSLGAAGRVSTLTAGASGRIALGTVGNTLSGLFSVTGGDVQLRSRAGLLLDNVNVNSLDIQANDGLSLGYGNIRGDLVARTSGVVIQAGGVTVEGTTLIDAGAGAITLSNAGNDFQGAVTLRGGTTTIHDANTLTLGTLDVAGLTAVSGGALNLGQGDIAGNLTAQASGGVSQGGALAVGGATTIAAGGNSIDLGDAGNAFGGLVSLAGSGATITSGGGLQFGTLAVSGLTATSNGELILGRGTVSGALSATSNGGRVAQSGALNVVGPAHIDAGSGAIELSNAGNLFSGAVSLTGGSAAIRSASGLTLGTLGLSGDLVANSQGGLGLGEGRIDGALVAGSAGGAIGQASGGLTVAGSATIDAGAGNITLDAGNDFRGPVALTGGAVRVRDVDDLEIGALVGGTGGVDLQAGNLLLAAGDIDTGGADLRLVAEGTLATPGALRGANVTLRGGTGLDLDHDVTATSGLSLAGGAIQQNAGRIAAARLDVEGGSARLDATGNAVAALGDVDLAGAFALRNAQAILQAAGASVEVGGAASFDAGGQQIVLASAGNDFGGPVSLTGSDVTIRDINALTLGNLAVSGDLVATSTGDLGLGAGRIDGSLTAISNGGNVGQSGALSVGGTAGIDAGSGDIALADAGNAFGDVITLTGGVAAIRDSGGLTLGTLDVTGLTATSGGALDLGQGRIGGDLVAASGGNAITQSGALTVDGTSALDAGRATIDLTHAGNDFGGALSLTGGSVTIRDANAMTLGTLDVTALNAASGATLDLGQGDIAGNLTANAGGAVSQAGALTVGGVTTIDANGHAIVLDDAGNDFAGVVNLAGGAAAIRDANALRLGTLNVAALDATAAAALDLGQGDIAGGLTANAGGAVSQSGALAVGGTTRIDANGHAIALADAGNDFAGVVNLAGGTAAIRDANALTLGTLDVTALDATAGGALNLGQGDIAGDLTANAGGAVTQSGALTVGGTTRIDANGHAIVLADAGNDFGGAVNLTGGTATIHDRNDLALGALDVAALDAVSGGALDLGQGAIAGDLTANAGGAVSQVGALTVGGTTRVDANGHAIALADAGNDFAGVVNLAGGTAAIRDANALTLGTLDVTALDATAGGALNLGQGDIAGDLTANAGGAVTQSGALTVDGTTTVDANGHAIVLADAGNDFGGAVNLTGGAATIRDRNDLALGALDVVALDATSGGALDLGQGDIAGDLTANAGGAVSQRAALTVGGMTTIDANGHAIVLDEAGNAFTGTVNLAGGATAIRDANALTLGTLDVTALDAAAGGALDLGQGAIAGDLTANTGGAVSQSGALTVGGVTAIDANGHAIVLADAGNDFAGVVNLAGGATAIRDANALTLGALDVVALDVAAGGALDLGQGAIAGDLTANADGALSQAGALTVGGTTRIDANGHAIVLDDAGNDFGGAVSLAGGTVAIRDANALRLGTLDVAALDAVSGGALDLGQGDIGGDLTANAGGAVTQSGALTVDGTTTVDANGHAIALVDAGNDFADLVNLAGGTAAIRDANALRLGTLDVAALDAVSGSALDLGQGGIGGDLTANAGGAVSQAGALTVGGVTTIDGNGHAIVLDDADNDFAGTVNLAGGATAIRDANGLRLGALDVAALDVAAGGALDLGQGGIAGNLTVDASGAVSQRAALTVGGTTTIDANGHAIALADAGNDFRGVVSLIGGDTIIRDVNALALGTLDVGALNATSHGDLGLGRGSVLGDLVATTNGGAVTQSGALGVGGSVRIDSQAGGGSSRMAGTITLADGGNDFRGGVHLRGGDTTIRDANQLTLDTLDVGALTATSQGELDLGQGSIRGDLDARSNGGDIGQSGALRIGGETVLAADNGDVVLDDIGNDFVGGVRVGGHSVRLADANDLHVLGLDSGGGDVSLHALGRLTVPALDVGGGALTLINGTGSLTTHGALRGAEISLSAQDDIVLAHDIAAGRLALEAGGDIAQQGGTLAADALTGRAGGVVSLGGANAVAAVDGFTAGAFTLRTSGPLAVTGDLVADGLLSLHVGQGGLALAATAQGRDVRLEVDGDIEAGGAGQIVAGTLSGHAGGATRLGGADGFVDNRIGILGDFRSHGGFSLSNGQDLTLSSLNGSAHSVDAGEAAFHLSLQGSLRQAGTAPILNGTGSYAVTGGIGTMDSPIYVVGHQPQVVQALGIPPAYFYATHVDGTPLPIEGNAVNVPTSVFSSRAQASLNRTVAYVDLGADASNYRPYGVVQPGVRLPADQQPECDPDFPSPECVEAQAASEPVASTLPGAAAQQRMWLQ